MYETSAPDAFFRLLTEHWTQILASVDEATRRALEGLADGEVTDPVELQEALEDLLLGALPSDHPVVELMRQRLMLHSDTIPWPRLSERQAQWRRAILVDPGAPPANEQTRPPRAVPDAGSRDLMSEVRRGLLMEVATYDSAEVAAWANRADLIRLRADDGTTRLPAFQFRGRPIGVRDEPGEPDSVVVQTNAVLRAERDPWGAASWWAYPHACIGVAPVELLGSAREEWLPVLAARLGED